MTRLKVLSNKVLGMSMRQDITRGREDGRLFILHHYPLGTKSKKDEKDRQRAWGKGEI
jgi:hypothetical protein